MRYEYEGAPTEADNANVRGFDPTRDPGGHRGRRAPRTRCNPIVELPAAQFNPVGGVTFASDSNPGFWNADTNNWQPRVSAAYQVNDRTVLRGGWAIYTVPLLFDYAVFQPGFAQQTPIVVSNDSGLTFQSNLTNPFPNGAVQPAGNSNGVNTFVGQNLSRYTTNVDAQQRAGDALGGQRAARDLRQLGGRGRLHRQQGLRPDRRDRHQPDPGAVPVDEPGARQRGHRQPVAAGAPIRSRACCPAPG